ncbi:MAG: hypothetical protein M0Z99_08390 [Betaproteobacteria bacterium]|nr:hypothetical protein [Betaproteobacteria bacterium]
MAALAAARLVAGCQSMGPGTVPRDRTNYADAIADSWKEQALLNVVRLRYFDTPVLLDVSSVISSYTLQGEVNAQQRVYGSSSSTVKEPICTLGISGTYTDRPTITYTPVSGKKYSESLLQPISPQAVLAMLQAGHPADFILSLAVRGINGVFNYSASPARKRPEDEAFRRVINAMRRLQQAEALDIRFEKRGAEDVSLISFHQGMSPSVDKDIRFVKETLRIDPDSRELVVSFGSAPRGRGEIALLTRSMWEIMAELSAGVDVPQQDLADGRATAAPPPGDIQREMPIAHIYSSAGPPQDAYIAVRYQDHWFWISNRDLKSKRVFTFLMVFSSIAETGAAPQIPVVTIPAN